MKRTDPELIRELATRVDYDPETGHFTWKPGTRKFGRTIFPGERAGDLAPHGYYRLSIRNTKVSAHIVAWYIVYGEIPDLPIDHINQDKSDNRIENLRVVSQSVNFLNSDRSHLNKTGLSGVTKVGRKFHSRVSLNRKLYHVGSFDTPEEANAAYMKKKAQLIADNIRALQSEER